MLLFKPLRNIETKRLAAFYIGEEKFRNGLTKGLLRKILAKAHKIKNSIKKEERAKDRHIDKYLHEDH
jgi:hypothetical protein